MPTPAELHAALTADRKAAIALVQAKGLNGTHALLQKAHADLLKRLARVEAPGGAGKDSYTAARLRATIRQVEAVQKPLIAGLKQVILGAGEEASTLGAGSVAKALEDGEKAFRGPAATPLGLKEALMLEAGRYGAKSSILMRLASSGEPVAGADGVPHKAKLGILDRYGVETVKNFEQILQLGLIQGKSWSEMSDDLTLASPFLQGAPAHWAERIVRTEVMAAHGKGAWEAVREADEQLGDMVKILSATFDNRTGADSFAVHGQIRRPDEAFESWFGLYQHPPNRPNDREVVLPHRISWPIPEHLAWKTDAEVAARWAQEKRKGAPPARPKMTTVPREEFGKPPKKLEKKTEKEVEPREQEEQQPYVSPSATKGHAYVERTEMKATLRPEEETQPYVSPSAQGREWQPPPKTPKLTKAQKLAKAKADLEALETLGSYNPKTKLPAPIVSMAEYDQALADAYNAIPGGVESVAQAAKVAGFAKEKSVKVGGLLSFNSYAVASKAQIAEAIDTAAEGKPPPLVVYKFKGEHVLAAGQAKGAAAQVLLGAEKVKANVIDLDKQIKAQKVAAVAKKEEVKLPSATDQKVTPGTLERAELLEKGKKLFASLPESVRNDFDDKRPPGYNAAVTSQPMKLEKKHREAISKFSHGYDFMIRQHELGTPREKMIELAKAHGSYFSYGGTPKKHVDQAIEASNAINDAFNHRVPTPGQVYRGIAVNRAQMARLLTEDNIHTPAASSTSWKFSTAMSFSSPKDTSRNNRVIFRFQQKTGMAIKAMSKHTGEEEILLQKGTKFRITGRSKLEHLGSNVLIIDAEEV